MEHARARLSQAEKEVLHIDRRGHDARFDMLRESFWKEKVDLMLADGLTARDPLLRLAEREEAAEKERYLAARRRVDICRAELEAKAVEVDALEREIRKLQRHERTRDERYSNYWRDDVRFEEDVQPRSRSDYRHERPSYNSAQPRNLRPDSPQLGNPLRSRSRRYTNRDQDRDTRQPPRQDSYGHRSHYDTRDPYDTPSPPRRYEPDDTPPSKRGDSSSHRPRYNKREHKPSSDPEPRRTPSADYIPQVEAWYTRTLAALTPEGKARLTTFPCPPPASCENQSCDVAEKLAPGVCSCAIRAALLAAPLKDGFKKESRRWHPDTFSHCPEEYREEMKRKADIVFKVVKEL